jgi:hypothetical protein
MTRRSSDRVGAVREEARRRVAIAVVRWNLRAFADAVDEVRGRFAGTLLETAGTLRARAQPRVGERRDGAGAVRPRRFGRL